MIARGVEERHEDVVGMGDEWLFRAAGLGGYDGRILYM